MSPNVSGAAVPDVSLVVPTYERRASVERLLDALTRQTLPPHRFEVIVVADGSSDGTAAMVAARRTPFALTGRWQPNAGRAAACNAGIARARGEVVVLLDDDMEPTPGLLAAHAAAHPPASRRAVVGAAPVVVEPDSPAVVRYVGRKFNRHLEVLATPGRPFGLRDFYSGNFSIRRAVLDEVGAFDERFRIYGNEDVELGWRLRRAGVALVFDAAAAARQYYTKDFGALMRDNLAKGRTAVLLTTRHPDALGESKLGDAGRGSRSRRLVLGGLLAAGRAWPATTRVVSAAVPALGRAVPPAVDRLYALAADYHFWTGARAARAEAGRPEAGGRGAEGARELEHNARLRRADWRFLLDDPAPATIVCFGGGRLREAASVLSPRVAAPDAAPAERYDLAVAADAGAATLRAAFARLRPGGTCYVECRGLSARPGVVRRRLLAAGFADVRRYSAWPSVRHALVWLPLDAPEVVSAYLDRDGRVPHGLLRRLVRRGRRRLVRWRGALGVTGHLGAIATKAPAGPATGFLPRLRDGRPDGAGPPASSRAAYVMLTGGERSISKVVILAYARADREPGAVVKIARVPEAARGLEAEARTLDVVHALRPRAPAGAPRVLFRWRSGGMLAVGESAQSGVPITGTLARARYEEIARGATTWLAELARASCAPAPDWADVSGGLLREFVTSHGAALDAALPDAIVRRLAPNVALPGALEHRDFSPWNVFLDDPLTVLDWESAVRHGLPALDLVYFLTYLAFYRDRVLGSRLRRADVRAHRASYRAAWDPAAPSGRVNDACLRDYARAVGFDPGALPALRLLTWLVHARSEYAHAVADAGGPPSPETLRRGLFVNLVGEELLRGDPAS
ncbi:hypothetical protein tb265_16200 [Gemmatimonadetes bacterium T265]|nr:hypothetical protein tb265_16200 [Gemmatimonadetes bacterium T265]